MWFNPARNKFFERSGVSTKPSGLHLRRGMYVSVRPAQDNGLLLNVNIATSAFFDQQSVLSLIQAYFSLQSHEQFPDSKRRDLETLLKGLRIRMMYLQGSPLRFLQQNQYLTDGPVKKVFGVETNSEKVAQAIQRAGLPSSDAQLKYPAIDVGSLARPVLVPAALLWIEPHQIHGGLLDPRVASSMIDAARKKPAENLQLIDEKYRPALESSAAELQIAHTPMVVGTAKILYPPKVSYNNTSQNDRVLSMGSWNCKGLSVKSPQPFGAPIFLVRKVFVNPRLREACNQLVKRINATCKPGYDVKLTQVQPLEDLKTEHFQSWLNTAKSAPEHVFIILDRQRVDVDSFADVKEYFDRFTGIPSTCIQLEKLQKNDQSFASNIALKVNVLYGGTNQTAKLTIPPNTMLVGADVTHPGHAAVSGAPSIAAAVASTDDKYTHYPGSARLQISKQEIIADLKGMMVERLQAYHRHNSRLPDNILFFRDGVREGQFSHVKTRELPQIGQACEELCGKGKKINVTFIITNKRHHTRFFKTKNTDKQHLDRNENFHPGLVVEDGVTSPGNNDSYMQSHKALAGTARPCHCFVIENEIGANAFQLQSLVILLICSCLPLQTSPVLSSENMYLPAKIVPFYGQIRWLPLEIGRNADISCLDLWSLLHLRNRDHIRFLCDSGLLRRPSM